ncbi:MAG: hypothetical protein ACLP7P_07540 [Rhodomicrobium sp.]
MASALHQASAGHKEAGYFAYKGVIDEICGLNWSRLTRDELINVAWAYYYFSTQFRENLEIALSFYPDDERLQDLDRGERNTDNLSPWPGVAAPGEKMHHEEFMRRTLTLTPIPGERRRWLEARGESYLAGVHALDKMTRAISLAAYEDGGLEAVFRSILKAPEWDGELLGAFKHFLVGHIALDSDPDGGHGALCRHLVPDDRILPLWTAFRQILIDAAPSLAA